MEEIRKPARAARAKAAVRPAAKKAAAPAKPRARTTTGAASTAAAVSAAPVEREEMVRMAAYFRAERRGFAPGHDWEDWLEAEAEVSTPSAAPAPRARKPARRKTRAE